MTALACPVAIIGAGPYALAAAAHLRAAKVDVCVFGKPMEFWRQMPAGMLLRSTWEGSHIADPLGELTLDRYQQTRGIQLPRPIRLEDFIDYGRWFQRQAVPHLDARQGATRSRLRKVSNHVPGWRSGLGAARSHCHRNRLLR